MNINNKFDSALRYYQGGKFEEAVKTCKDIIKKNPGHVNALHLLAILHYQSQEYNLAVKCIQEIVNLDPNNFYVYFLLGNISSERGNSEKAITYFQKTIELNPSFGDAHYNLAIIYEKLNQFENALISYNNALSLNPHLSDVYNNLGNLLTKMKDFDQAIPYLRKALQLNPNYILALNNLGIALKEKRYFDEALVHFQKAIDLNPSFADAYYNLAIILKEKDQTDKAIISLQKAIDLNPSFADAYCNLAIAFEESGRLNDALAYYQKALQITPDDAEVHWNMSLTYLSSGDFTQGWQKYEWRFGIKEFKQRTFPMPRWDGSSLVGKSLFVHAEQGIGEEIMFISCLPEVMEQAGLCVVECDRRLVPLFSRSFPKIKVLERINTIDQYPSILSQADIRIAIGSLPKFLRPDLASFPQQERYLNPDSQKVENWHKRFSELGPGLKIGISWRGGSKTSEKHLRSTVLAQWRTLFSLPGVQYINLQYGDCNNELREAREQLGVTIHDWEDADPLKDLDNFAAQISALDLVISVDNATVHMAGALGIPVWVLLPSVCDWRWLRDVDDTPWYKSVRLIRHEKAGDWDGVFQRAASDLRHYLETGLMPEITRSYKSSLSAVTTVHEPAAPSLSLPSDKTYRCAVITPIGPGHETLYEESLASVKRSFADRRGNFSEIIPIRIDDPEGKLGRSKARNLGIQKAVEYGVEWIFFLDADDLMAPSAFEYVSPYLEGYDGIWGCIWTIEQGETTARERPQQLPFLYSIEDVTSCDPFVTLQMGHFVRTHVALSTLFDESLDTGEDFDYYLRVWEKYTCIKIPLPFFYNRRGFHSKGPRSATGREWNQQVENIIKKRYLHG